MEERDKEAAYRIYVTDTLYCIAKSTAALVNGPSPKRRYFELLDAEEPEEMDGNKIAADVIARCGLEVI